MSKNRSPLIISTIICLLIGIGLTFQNCAEPLDPALLSESLPSDSDGSNNGTDNTSNNITVETPTFSFNLNPIKEGQPAVINPNIVTNYTGELQHEWQKNGIKISNSQSLLVGNLSVGDSIDYIVTAGSIVKYTNVPLDIQPSDNNPPTEPPSTGNGSVALRAVPGTNEFKSYYVNSGDELNFAVEIDQANSDQAAHNSPISWETKDIRNTTWKYHSSSRDLKVTADHVKLRLYYRAKTTFRGVTKYSSTIMVTAQHYTSADKCITPYVASAINSYSKFKIGTNCSDDGRNCSDYYAYNINNIRCSVLQKKNTPTTHFGVYITPVTANAYKGSWTSCGSGNVDLKSSFVSDLKPANSRSKNYGYACTRPSIGNSKILTVKEVTKSGSTAALECDEYSYITDFHRYSSYSSGLIERIKCAVID